VIKKSFVSIAVLAGLSLPGHSFAQDMFDWSGFYIGANAGYGFGQGVLNHEYDLINDAPNEYKSTLDLRGFSAGLFVGAQVQIDQFVVGIEQDVQITGLSGSGTFSYYDNEADPPGVYDNPNNTGSLSFAWKGSSRIRLGVPLENNIMPFVTAGVAYGQGTLSAHQADWDPPGNVPQSGNFTALGGTIGAGIDVAVTDTIILRGEGRFTSFMPITAMTTGDDAMDNYRVSANIFELLVGVSAKFN